MKKTGKRRKERELALWGLFRQDFDEDGAPDAQIADMLADFPDEDSIASLKNASGDYANSIIAAYIDHKDETDALIGKYLKENWAFERLPKIEKAIMRMAASEMFFVPQPVPKEIVIDEAVELAKKYADDGATGYINGVLNHMAQELPSREETSKAAHNNDKNAQADKPTAPAPEDEPVND